MKKEVQVITHFKPGKLQKIFCPTKGCGELMIKVYPWSDLTIQGVINPCKRCLNKRLLAQRRALTVK